jgi:plastocyanin
MRMLSLILFASVSILAGEGGTLSGVVKHDGPPPPQQPRKVGEQALKDCPKAAGLDDGSLVMNPANNGLKWGIVRIMVENAVPLPPPANPVQIDQAGCLYEPHAAIIAPGQKVQMLNPDKVAHTITLLPLEGVNAPGNFMMLASELVKDIPAKHVKAPEVVQLSCIPHPWMKSFLVVHDPRFAAITDADGKFEINNVPPGKYRVVFTHDLGEQEKELEIKPGSKTDAGTILFKRKAESK